MRHAADCAQKYDERVWLSRPFRSSLLSAVLGLVVIAPLGSEAAAGDASPLGSAFHVSSDPEALAEQRRFELLNSLLSIDAQHSGLCSTALDEQASRREIGRLAYLVRQKIPAAPAITPEATVRAINEVVLGSEGIRSSQDLHDPCNLLIASVLALKRGYCVGVAGVYLSVADELGLPVYAVGTPFHVFLRYDDGVTRINIETDGGASLTNGQYFEQARISSESVQKGVFLRLLSRERFLAQVHNNLGVIYSERRDYSHAKPEYEAALRLDRKLPAAWYNLGRDLLSQGRPNDAVRAFTKAIRLHPNDTWAYNNRAMAYSALEKTSKARHDLELALEIDPSFEQAQANLKLLPSGR